MRIRKFEITSIEVEPKGFKPFYTVHYKGIKNKPQIATLFNLGIYGEDLIPLLT